MVKIVHRVSTGLVCAFLLWSALSYLFHPGTIDGIRELGFPAYFRIQLAVLKLVAIIALVVPQVPRHAKEWSYAGIGLFLLTAIVAHTAHGDPFVFTLANVAVFALVAVQRHTQPSRSKSNWA